MADNDILFSAVTGSPPLRLSPPATSSIPADLFPRISSLLAAVSSLESQVLASETLQHQLQAALVEERAYSSELSQRLAMFEQEPLAEFTFHGDSLQERYDSLFSAFSVLQQQHRKLFPSLGELHALREERERLKSWLHSTEAELADLRPQLSVLRANVAAATSTKQELETEVQVLRQTLLERDRALQDAMQRARDSRDLPSNDISLSAALSTEFQRGLEHSRQAALTAQFEIDSYKKQIHERDGVIRLFEAERESIQASLDELREEENSARQELSLCQQQLVRCQEQLKALQEQHVTLNHKHTASKHRLEEVLAECASLKESATSFEQALAAKTSELDTCRTEQDELKRFNAELLSSLGTEKEQANRGFAAETLARNRENEIAEISNRLQQVSRELQEARKEQAQQDNTNLELQQRIGHIKGMLSVKDAEVEAAKASAAASQAALREHQFLLSRFAEEENALHPEIVLVVVKLKSIVQDLQSQLSNSLHERDALSGEVSALRGQLQIVSIRAASPRSQPKGVDYALQRRAALAEEKLHDLQAQNVALVSSNTEQREKLDALEQRLRECAVKEVQLKLSSETAQQREKAARDELAKSQAALNDATAQAHQAQTTIEGLRAKISWLEERREELAAALADTKNDKTVAETASIGAAIRMQEIVEDCSRLRRELEANQAQIEQYRRNTANTATLEDEMETLQRSHAQAMNEAQEKVNRLRLQLTECQDLLQHERNEANILERSQRQSAELLKARDESFAALRLQLAEMSATLEESQANLELTQAELDLSRETQQKAAVAESQLRQKLSLLQKRADLATEFEIELVRVKAVAEGSANELATLRERESNLQDSHRKLSEARNELHLENCRLEEGKRILEDELRRVNADLTEAKRDRRLVAVPQSPNQTDSAFLESRERLIAEFRAQNEQLTDELRRMRQQLQAARTEANTLGKQCSTLQETQAEAHQKLQEVNLKLQVVTQESKLSHKRLLEVDDELRETRLDLTNCEAKLNSVSAKLSEKTLQAKHLQEQYNRVAESKKATEAELEETRLKCESLQLQLDSALQFAKDAARLDATVQALQGEKATLEQKVLELSATVDYTNTEDAIALTRAKERLAHQSQEITRLTAVIAEKESEHEAEIADLRRAAANDQLLSVLRSQLADQEASSAALRRSLVQRDEEIADLAERMTTLESEHSQAKASCAGLESKLRDLQNQMAAAEEQAVEREQSLRQKLEKLTKRHEEVTASHRELAEQLGHLEERQLALQLQALQDMRVIEHSARRCQELEEARDRVQLAMWENDKSEDVRRLRSALDNANATQLRIQGQLDAANGSVQRSAAQLAAKSAETETLRESNEAAELRATRLATQVEQLQQKQRALSDEVATLRDTVQQGVVQTTEAQRQIVLLEAQLQQQKDENTNLSACGSTLRREKQLSQSNNFTLLARLETSERELIAAQSNSVFEQVCLQSKDITLTELRATTNTLAAENSATKLQLRLAIEDAKGFCMNSIQKLQALREQVNYLEETCDSTRHELSASNESVSRLSASIRDLETRCSEIPLLHHLIQTHEATQRELEQQVASLQSELAMVHGAASERGAKLTAAAVAEENLQHQLASALEDLQTERSNNQNLRNDLAHLSSKSAENVAELQETVAALRTTLADTKEQCQNHLADMSDLQEVLQTSREHTRLLEEELETLKQEKSAAEESCGEQKLRLERLQKQLEATSLQGNDLQDTLAAETERLLEKTQEADTLREQLQTTQGRLAAIVTESFALRQTGLDLQADLAVAKLHQEESGEWRELEAAMQVGEKCDASTKLAALQSELYATCQLLTETQQSTTAQIELLQSTLTENAAELERVRTDADLQIEELRSSLLEKEMEEAAAQLQVSKHEKTIAELQNDLEQAKGTLAEKLRQIAENQFELQALKATSSSSAEEKERIHTELLAELAARSEALGNSAAENLELEAQITAAKTMISSLEEACNALKDQVASLSAREAATAESLRLATEASSGIALEFDQLERRLAATESRNESVQQLCSQLESRKNDVTRLEAELYAIRSELDAERTSHVQQRLERDEAEDKCHRLESELLRLQESQAEILSRVESSRSIMELSRSRSRDDTTRVQLLQANVERLEAELAERRAIPDLRHQLAHANKELDEIRAELALRLEQIEHTAEQEVLFEELKDDWEIKVSQLEAEIRVMRSQNLALEQQLEAAQQALQKAELRLAQQAAAPPTPESPPTSPKRAPPPKPPPVESSPPVSKPAAAPAAPVPAPPAPAEKEVPAAAPIAAKPKPAIKIAVPGKKASPVKRVTLPPE
eukprot:TRINITY_DN11923_c0_g3_i1.p1 TRINITY_DN11923_c0_g3~~TRINITY_DN11923_c0_g3_i1.p1  ORF type:complete len:2410 (+),score=573.70 TRINITY_DN11923_c0_g3_i1:280-7230(+)